MQLLTCANTKPFWISTYNSLKLNIMLGMFLSTQILVLLTVQCNANIIYRRNTPCLNFWFSLVTFTGCKKPNLILKNPILPNNPIYLPEGLWVHPPNFYQIWILFSNMIGLFHTLTEKFFFHKICDTSLWFLNQICLHYGDNSSSHCALHKNNSTVYSFVVSKMNTTFPCEILKPSIYLLAVSWLVLFHAN